MISQTGYNPILITSAEKKLRIQKHYAQISVSKKLISSSVQGETSFYAFGVIRPGISGRKHDPLRPLFYGSSKTDVMFSDHCESG